MSISDELRKRHLYDIAEDIARGLHLTVEQMLSTRRYPAADGRRSLYAYLRALGWSYPAIGKLLGRDHTTVMTALMEPAKRAARDQRGKERWSAR